MTDLVTTAAAFILDGEVVAFPTETVYGLGANIFDERAIARIFEAKGRPTDNPLIAHIGELAQLGSIASEVPESAWLLIESFFPGPLTVVLPKRERVPAMATAGLETVGVRMPDHQLALDFLRACGVPLVAPSANLSGRPSPTTWQAVMADLDGRISCILRGDPTRIGLESTVVDCSTTPPTLLRAGAITIESLRRLVPAISLANRTESGTPKSPGMKYRHYSPRARVVLCEAPPLGAQADQRLAYIGMTPPADTDIFLRIAVCVDVAEYGRRLFAFFRECDEAGVSTIYCQTVSRAGFGLALMDRLEKAAAG